MLNADPLAALDLMNADAPILSPSAPILIAREMVRQHYMHGDHQTLHHLQGTFYTWHGTHYAELPPESIRAAIWIFLEDAVVKDDDGKLLPFAPNKHRVANVLEALAAVCQLPAHTRAPAWVDHDEHLRAAELLSCANGLLHLPTRTLLPHSPAFFAVNTVGFGYDERAPEAQKWRAFLQSVWPHDHELIDTLQELFGLLLTRDTRHQKVFLLVGPRRSGKGTIARVLTEMLGRPNVANPTLAGLGQNFGLAPLIGKPLALISDAKLSGRADQHAIAERLLSISGEDGLTIDRKFLPAWTGTLPTRFVILSNELSRLTDASGALAGRFIILQLTNSFCGREDLTLTGKLLPELSGILNWAITGLDRLTARGHFVQPASARQAVQDLEDLASPIGAFLRERCVIDPARCVDCDRLYAAWTAWCEAQGREHPGTKQTFGRDLRAALPSVEMIRPRDAQTGERPRYYQGLDLQ